MPGAWLPFDEVLPETMGGWINKWRFTDPQHGGVAEGDPSGLHRFGTEENRDISNTLGTMTIPPGRPATPSEVNDWLDSNGVPTTPTTLYRRGPPDDDLPPTQR
jgi:hypothetical protein